MSKRPSEEFVYLSIAGLWALRSTCSSKIAVGAVLVSPDGRVIASGYNGSPIGQPHCDDDGCITDELNHCVRAIHAEANAIIQCARHGVSCVGATAYVTHEPCNNCYNLMVQAGIVRIVYVIPYRGDDARAGEPIPKEKYPTEGV